MHIDDDARIVKMKISQIEVTSNDDATSAYNLFMAKELPKMKVARPELNHKDAFKEVAKSWATNPANPKNAAK